MEVVPQEIPGIKQISTIMRKFPNALKFYFTAKAALKKKEEEFILNELAHYESTREAYSFEETFKDGQ